MDRRHELTQRDLEVLKYYATEKNRELYWNYLAQLPGNDGYGRLALGVVRNDNMPGATANAYAQQYAWEHDHKRFTEREWDTFGVDLIHRDLQKRIRQLENGHPDLALNLPAAAVQDAHDKSFIKIGVDPNAWTPRKLLEAARKHGTENDVEAIWSGMLNNDYAGINRAFGTVGSLAHGYGMPWRELAAYSADMTRAYVSAMNDRPHIRPDIIGETQHYYMRDRTGAWSEVHHAMPNMTGRLDFIHDVRDPQQRRQLEDTRQLRQYRADARDAFHEYDPRRLVPSPHPLAVRPPRPRVSYPSPGDDAVYAQMRLAMPNTICNDKVAEAAAAAHRCGIRTADQLTDVTLCDDRIEFSGRRYHQEGLVSLDTDAPPREQSFALIEQLDAQAVMDQQLAQQQSMSMDGPSMSM